MTEMQEAMLAELAWLKAKDRDPFPYEGCRRIMGLAPDFYHALIPDLDLYFSMIAGHRSWGKKILKWSEAKLREVDDALCRSFFDRHPEYTGLQPLLASGIAPDVAQQFELAERSRSILRELIRTLQSDLDRNT